MNQVVRGSTFADAYRKALVSVMQDPDYKCSPRGIGVAESLDFTMVIDDPCSRFYYNAVRPSPFKYIMAELVWYLSGDRSSDWIGKFGSIWNRICDMSGKVNSQYGYLTLFKRYADGISGYQYALKCLLNDKDSRKSVILYNSPDICAVETRDTVCTFSNQFFIRDNELHMVTNMRSNDMILGLPIDVVWFTLLQEQMLEDLRSRGFVGLKMGTYTHRSGSMHIYENNFETVERMLENNFYPISVGGTSLLFSMVTMDGELGSSFIPPIAVSDIQVAKDWLEGKYADRLPKFRLPLYSMIATAADFLEGKELDKVLVRAAGAPDQEAERTLEALIYPGEGTTEIGGQMDFSPYWLAVSHNDWQERQDRMLKALRAGEDYEEDFGGTDEG